MGLSRNSIGRRSDKETQSPVLKIFKDIMQKDIDPEKAKLLKEKHREKKQIPPCQRSKTDQILYDSSSADRMKQTKQNPIAVQDISDARSIFDYRKRRENPDVKKEKMNTSDTCSCVSCALKKIIGSERTCTVCLVLLFLLSVSAAFLLMFKAMPNTDAQLPDLDDDIMVNKIQRMKEKRQLNDKYDKVFTERQYWEEHPKDRFEIPSLMTQDQKIRLEEMNRPEESPTDDITYILNTDEIMNSSNERLRDFYKRLLETDAQIKRVRENRFDNYKNSNEKIITDRFKRSFDMKQFIFPKIGLFNKPHQIMENITDKTSNRLISGSNITGFVVKNEKFIVKFDPDKRRNYPKCSHNHNEMSHEEHLKHPFYKHSQRIDEMLKENTKPVTEDMIYANNIKTKPDTDAKDKTDEKDSLDLSYYLDIDKISSSTPGSNVALDTQSVDENIQKLSKYSNNHHRRLLQVVTEEGDEIDYQDEKEIERDDEKTSGTFKKQNEKKKADFEDFVQLPIQNSQKNVPKGYNSDQKEPMPLSPDELNLIIEQAALQNYNIKIPVDTKDNQPEIENEENEISDTQYIEDYADNKYNKMVEVAQAYSDYGVLIDKKEAIADKDRISNNNKKKSFLDTEMIKKNIDRLRKGIKYNNQQINLLKTIQKHMKFSKDPVSNIPSTSIDTNHEKLYSNNLLSAKETSTIQPFRENVFEYKKRNGRSLKSIKEANETLIEDYDNINYIKENIKRVPNYNATVNMFKFLSSMGDWFLKRTVVAVSTTTTQSSRINSNFNGIRSRVLMAYDNNETSKNDLAITENINPINNTTDNDREVASKDSVDNILPIILTMVSENKDPVITHSKENNIYTMNNTKNEYSRNIKNKTVAKRNVDNKFVFWNDLYDDDEYGVKLDYLDQKMRRDTKKNRIQKSKNWIKEKVYKLKGKKNKPKRLKTIDLNSLSTKKSSVEETLQNISKKRKIRSLEFDEGKDMGDMFKKLTANMKKVCRDAADAIQNTRRLEVRESKDSLATTTLMQRLIRLMTDLVDIQVQEKTCASLPPDLRQFLEWLIAPAEEHPQSDHLNPDMSNYVVANEEYGGRLEKSNDETPKFSSLTEDTHQDDRTECLGIIRAVQDLVEEYEGLSNEDKSKMYGVKEYLQRQLEYLNNIARPDDRNIYNLYEKREVRDKRESDKMKDNEKPTNKKNKNFKDLVQRFRKKYTKALTTVYARTNNVFTKDKDTGYKTQTIRNINDVYYKALEEAKKTTKVTPEKR